MKRVTSIVAIAGLSALFLSPATFDLPYSGLGAAFAKGGNGNGGGDGGSNGGGNGKSESKGSSGKGSDKGSDKGGSKGEAKSASKSTGGTKKKAAKIGKEPELTPELASVEIEEKPKNAHGLLASELKGLNAVHANPNALENASPNSQVGRIALYRDAARATIVAGEAVTLAEGDLALAQDDLVTAIAALDAYDASYSGRLLSDIDADIAALDPADPAYQTTLDALTAERDAAVSYEEGRVQLAADLDAATTGVFDAEAALDEATTAAEDAQASEDEALLTASNGRDLSDEAIAYIREQLGL